MTTISLGQIERMPIPDNVWFCSTKDGEHINFEELRNILEKKEGAYIERLRSILYDRQDAQLIRAGQLLHDNKQPFALAVFTCTCISALGNVFYKSKSNKESFIKTLGKMHQHLSKPLGKEFGKTVNNRWEESENELKSRGELIYIFLRNSLQHDFVARGVYLKAEIKTIEESLEDGYLVINPYWFWEVFKKSWNAHFTSNKKPQEVLNYFNRITD